MKLFSATSMLAILGCAMLIMAPSVSAEPLHESSSRHAVVHTHRVVNRVVVARPMLIRTVTTISAFSLNNLPAGYARLIRGDETFYFSRGVYYKRKPHGFVIVKPRVGFSVAVLPSGYKTIRDSGATFYSFNNVRYRKHNGFFVVV